MDPLDSTSLPIRSKSAPRTNHPTPVPPVLQYSSLPNQRSPEIYLPDAPKLWTIEQLTGAPPKDTDFHKDRNNSGTAQWLHIRIHPSATIDDQSTEEGKTWMNALEALKGSYHGDPSVNWGRVVEAERWARGEVVVVCDLRSGHWMNAFVKSRAYAQFWETIDPLLAEKPRAFYLYGTGSGWTGHVSITDVHFAPPVSNAATELFRKMLGRNYFIHRKDKHDLSCSCDFWIEDDTLEWKGQKSLVRRYATKWTSAEGEAKFKGKEIVFVRGGICLVEDNFWEDLKHLGMLGFEEYHCIFSNKYR